ncbi:MAG: response regulator [Desulfobacterales bacterium]|nr:response regulator [Desulfobacterales bacterium]
MKILLVEDVRVERLKLRRWLEELNCEVIEATNGNEGLDRYSDCRPDLVISDIVMPEKDGIQMMVALQRKHPDITIFAISGAGAKEPGEYLYFAEKVALRTFVKPIDKDQFLSAVAEQIPESNPKR